AEDIKAGDTITFYSPLSEKLTSHRVIAVEDGSSPSFRTKGDANEDADPFMERVDKHRRGIGLPLRMFTIDPEHFYYVENLERKEVVLGVEWAEVRESDVKPDGSFTEKGDFVVVRTKDQIIHHWVPGGVVSNSEVVFEGENRFGHTGYFLYRGLYTSFGDPERQYDPFAIVSINQAQHRNLFMTLQASYGIQAGIHWLESDLDRGARSSRAVST
ncbi:hypothetical protein LCGC14_3014560, partial [marine sediment metagenome]